MSEISSIDDLLLTGSSSSQQPKAAEHIPDEAPDDTYEVEQAQEPVIEEEPEEVKEEPQAAKQDDYGNEVEKPRVYTEEEHRELVNRAVRDRMARFERNNAQAQPQTPVIPHPAQDFQYNPESSESWEAQLEAFVERTFDKISQKQVAQQQQLREQQINAEFETKLHHGMSKFKDFVEVVGRQPIDDAMTLATRGMSDPAAFLYAASKKAPEELARISQIQDPYTKMREIGNLEERLRKNKNTSNAPRPVSRTQGDSNLSTKSVNKELSIEEQIRLDADRKRKIMNERRRVK